MGFYFPLPDENALRASTTYHQIFALTLLWNVGLLGMVIVFLFIIFFVLKAYLIKTQTKKANRIRQSLLSEQSKQQSKRQSGRQSQNIVLTTEVPAEELDEIQIPTSKRFKICNFLTSFFFYFFWVDISLMYLCFYIFGYLGRGVSRDILAVFVILLVVVIPTLVWKNGTKVKKFRLIKKQIIFTAACLLLWLGLVIFMVITLKGACLCYYNDKYGFSVGSQQGPFLSTEWTRTNAIGKICKQNQICNLYATVPELPDQQVFINLHTGTNLQNITIRLIGPSNETFEQNITSYYTLGNVEQIGKRILHTALFQNLTADKTYRLLIYATPLPNKSYETPLKNTTYKTTPPKNATILKMAVGGDVSMTVDGLKLTQNLVAYNPDIIMIGGDITYDDGLRTCYYSWDNFYKIFQNLNVKLDRLVPLIMSVGNHDVGFDALSQVEVDRDKQQIPYFFLYNPQHLSNDDKNKIPQIKDRSTVHYHIIGNTVHLHLDSGYIQTFQNQKDQIIAIGKKYSDYYLFANYHNPIYPSCTDSTQNSNDIYVISNGTKHWTPLFDQYKFVAGFQHHTHHKKFTKKLYNGTAGKSGTRYVGDGSWGVIEGSCPEHKVNTKQNIFQFFDTKQPNHVWLVTLTKNQTYSINYTVIDCSGNVYNTTVDTLDNLGQ